jgi:hypothetical protein
MCFFCFVHVHLWWSIFIFSLWAKTQVGSPRNDIIPTKYLSYSLYVCLSVRHLLYPLTTVSTKHACKCFKLLSPCRILMKAKLSNYDLTSKFRSKVATAFTISCPMNPPMKLSI